jgi:ABC-type multidrug transport system fused ATPase/permease subunit
MPDERVVQRSFGLAASKNGAKPGQHGGESRKRTREQHMSAERRAQQESSITLFLTVAFGAALFLSVILVLSRFVTVEAIVGEEFAIALAALSLAASIVQYLVAPVAIVAVVWAALKYTEKAVADR